MKPGDFSIYGFDAVADAIELDQAAFDKGLVQGARQERKRIALRVNLEGIRSALEKGLILDENSRIVAEILVQELS